MYISHLCQEHFYTLILGSFATHIVMAEVDPAIAGLWWVAVIMLFGMFWLWWKGHMFEVRITTLREDHIQELDVIFAGFQSQIYAQANEHNNIFAELRARASQMSTMQFRLAELENECESLRRATTSSEQ